MENFDLSRLSATSFERLIRALCFELMGPGGTVYSSGPDGARDYTFEGHIKGYEPKGWNGYLVLQAKFREKPQGGLADVQWLEKQLAGELEKYKDRKANLRRPNFYIVASNVSLSGADGKGTKGSARIGGHTKISNYLKTWNKAIGVKDFDIWPADKIIDLLAGAPEVRQSYAAWITVGDVLSAVLKNFKAKNPDFSAIIGRGLKESLRRDQHARLRDAGSVIDSPIRVSQVFIDLPADHGKSETSYSANRREVLGTENVVRGVVARLAERSKERFDPESVALARQTPTGELLPSRNKVVILGGPGQGKSTASMFLAQLFRATLLEADPTTFQDDNVRGLVPEILQRAGKEGVSNALPRRYPVFVSLPRFADEITKAKSAHQPPPSLLTQIALELSIACDKEFDRDDLRAWLRLYPWIAIFDGLDEVPPSGERHAVIEAIASFNTEVIDLQADVLVVVTTRPQGYNHDLDESQWEHWRLNDLPSERAIAYAEALGNARYPSDPFRREDILESIKEATGKPATSRLMISPLQVTIMYLIVDTGGSVPAARWTLFNEYFETLRKREKAKGRVNQKILERNWSQLGPIHQRAGLVLQTDSEHVGSALSSLDKTRFKQMVCEFLSTYEYEKEEITARADELMNVALDRLVLLSSREEGKIAFDVRSLQEFMAAAALTSGNESNVEDRLSHIAGLSHWRHTFLIGASRCFSEDGLHHLRSIVVGIPRTLDSSLPDFYVRAGAYLSLEMFVDGIGSDHPRSRKLLAQHALELLALGPDSMDERLTLLVEEHTIDLVVTILREKIVEHSTPSALAAWKLVVILANRKKIPLLSLAEECWPDEPSLVINILSVLSEPLPTSTLIEKTRRAILRGKPSETQKCSSFFESLQQIKQWDMHPNHAPIMELNFRRDQRDNNAYVGILAAGSDAPLKIAVTGCRDQKPFKHFYSLDEAVDEWMPLIAAAKFTYDPSPERLSETLTAIVRTKSLDEAKRLRRYLPWPVASMVQAATDEIHLLELSDRALRCEFGDQSAWLAAESRWTKLGVTKDDFLHSPFDVPFTNKVADVGLPNFVAFRISHENNETRRIIQELVFLANDIGPCNTSVKLLELAQFAILGVDNGDPFLTGETGLSFFKSISDNQTQLSLHMLEFFDTSIWENDVIVGAISESVGRYSRFANEEINVPLAMVIRAFNRNPRCRGLLNLIAVSIAYGKEASFEVLNDLEHSAFRMESADHPIVRSSVTLLDMAHGGRPNPDYAAKILCASDDDRYATDLRLVGDFFEKDDFLINDRERYLTSLLRYLEGKSDSNVLKVRDALKKHLNSRRSTLTRRETWIDKLRLPSDAYTILQKQT